MKLYILLISISLTTLSGMSLEKLTKLSLKHSPLIQSAKAQAEVSRLNKEGSKAQQLGELNLVGDYTHYNIERTLAPLPPSAMMSGTPITTTKDLFSVGINYSVPLFTGYAQTRQIEIDSIASEMANSKIRLTKEQLVYNIRSLYLTALSLTEILDAQKGQTRVLRKIANLIKNEVNLGRKAEIELIKAEADYEASKVQESSLLSNIEITKAAISSISGVTLKSLVPVNTKVSKPQYSSSSLFKRIESLKKIEIEALQIKKAQKQIEKAKSASLPQVNLNAYMGKNFGQDIKSDEWDDETLWQIGVKGQYNLVDFGKRAINTEKARVGKIQAAIKKQQAVLETKKQIIEAVEKIKLAYSSYIGNLKQFKLGSKSLAIEQERYKNGASTINDLLLAVSKKQFAKAKLIESKYTYKKSIYYLDYILEKGIK